MVFDLITLKDTSLHNYIFLRYLFPSSIVTCSVAVCKVGNNETWFALIKYGTSIL